VTVTESGCTNFANDRGRSMMDIIRAWKDEEYRLSLTEEQRALLPDNPAGLPELSDSDLESVAGGFCNSFMGCTFMAINCQNQQTGIGFCDSSPSCPF
jgi:mersacidin/lichenicidin family type 2 lantibiotic